MKRLSYIATALIGVAAFLASMRPPDTLQDVIVFASGGVGAAFLVPMSLALFWKRANGAGIIAGMIGGTITHLVLHATNVKPLGLNPFVWDQLGSILALVSVTLLTTAPEKALVEKYFGKQAVAGSGERG